jgi:hypothetical protein
MQKRSRKKKDALTELASPIYNQASAETTVNGWANEGGVISDVPPIDPSKNPAAVKLGKLGGLEVDKTKAKKTTKKQKP